MVLQAQTSLRRDHHDNKHCFFCLLWALASKPQSYIHQTLLKIALALHIPVTYIHCSSKIKWSKIALCLCIKVTYKLSKNTIGKRITKVCLKTTLICTFKTYNNGRYLIGWKLSLFCNALTMFQRCDLYLLHFGPL
jgi:hypothetical protein